MSVLPERTRQDDCLSDLLLDRLWQRELPEPELVRVEAHLEECQRCRERQLHLQRERDALAGQIPEFKPVPATRSESPSVGRIAPVVGYGGAALAAAAALMLWVTARPTPPSEVSSGEAPGVVPEAANATRIKGGVSFGFHVRRDGHVELGEPGQVLWPGDAVRFSVSTPQPGYAAVFSRDAQGTVSVYHSEGNEMEQVRAGQRQPFSTAVELDGVLGEEILFGVFCENQQPIDRLRQSLPGATTALPLPAGCQLRTFKWFKETRK